MVPRMLTLSFLLLVCLVNSKPYKQAKPNLNNLIQRTKATEEKTIILIKFDEQEPECRRLLNEGLTTFPKDDSNSTHVDEQLLIKNLRTRLFHPFIEDTLKTKFGTIAGGDKLIEAPMEVKVFKQSSSLEDVTEYRISPSLAMSVDGIHRLESDDFSVVQSLTFRWLKNVKQETVECPNIINADKLVEHMRTTACVKFVAKSPKVGTLQILQDPLVTSQWWVHETDKFGSNLAEAHSIWDGGDVNFTVGVLDTGCDIEHPDMYKFGEYDQFAFNSAEAGGNTWDDYNNRQCSNRRDDDNNGVIDDCFGVNWNTMSGDAWDFVGHGTHVASIVAGASNNNLYTASSCPKCKVMCMMPLGHVTRSINYAIDRNVTVINWSGSYFRDGLTEDFKAIVSDALVVYEQEVSGLWVCAAGNHPVNLDLCMEDAVYPSSEVTASSPLKKGDETHGARPAICDGYDDSVTRQDYHFGFPCELSVTMPNVLCVGASDIDGNNAYFSTYGKKTVNVFAPGKDILAHFPVYMGNIVRILSGTSMASPLVAGVAGLVRSKYPSLSAFETRTIIEQSCQQRETLQDKTKCGGIVDAAEALKIAEAYVRT